MKLLSSMIEDINNYSEDIEKRYPVNRIYIGRLVRFINTRPNNIDSRDYIQKRFEPYLVLLKHETGNIYVDIETGEKFTAETISAVRTDPKYRFDKQYVSAESIERFKGRCFYPLRDGGLLDKNYLSVRQLREVLDAEFTWEDGMSL